MRTDQKEELASSLTDAGLAIAYRWKPGKNQSVFMVASKAGRGD